VPRITAVLGFGLWISVCRLLPGATPGEQAPEPPALHVQIDRLLERAAIGPLAPLCSDAEFLRRIHLDLTGGVPSADEVTAFLEDPAQDKRRLLVDRLLESSDFIRHMAVELDVVLLERRTDTLVAVGDWEQYLIDFLAADRPLDQLYQELLFYESDPTAVAPPAKFLLSRSAEPNAVTRDVGRLAFGKDLQCAQCHNHPLIADYLQDDYYGLYAFWHRTSLVTDPKSKASWITELAEGETRFESVFTGDGREAALPRPPLGQLLVDEPALLKTEAYLVQPSANQAGRPRHSRRQLLAEQLPDNLQFRRNVANRLWQKMFGRGLVHPLDLHHADNPPVNPQVLSLLADALAANQFQLRPMLRQLALTRAYQRSSSEPDPDCLNFQDIAARKVQLQADQARLSRAVVAAQDRLQAPQETYNRLLLQQEQVAAELPVLLKAANEAHDKWFTSQTVRDQQQSSRDQIATELAAVRAAAQACSHAVSVSSEDSSDKSDHSLLNISRQLEVKANQLAMRLTAAESALKTTLDSLATLSADFERAQTALAETDARQVQPDDLALVEQEYLAGRTELEQAIFEQRGVAASIELCELVAQFDAVREHDPAQADSLWRSLLEQWSHRQQIAAVRALSAEQLWVAMLQATGNWSPQVQAALSKLQTAPPQQLTQASADRRSQVEQRLLQSALLDQIRGSLKKFVDLFAGSPGEDFQATVNQALFVSNSTVIDELLKPREDNLSQRLLQVSNTEQWIDQLYLAILSRPATEEERQEIIELRGDDGINSEAFVREVQWALLSSAEFRFNH